MEVGHYKDNKDIGEEETGNGNQKVREKRGAAIIDPSPENGGANPNRKRQSPGDDGTYNKQGKTVEKSLPNLSEYGLVILPGNGFSCKEIAIEVNVLDINGSIQMKFLAKSFHNFGCKLGIQGVHLAGLARGQVNDQKRDH